MELILERALHVCWKKSDATPWKCWLISVLMLFKLSTKQQEREIFSSEEQIKTFAWTSLCELQSLVRKNILKALYQNRFSHNTGAEMFVVTWGIHWICLSNSSKAEKLPVTHLWYWCGSGMGKQGDLHLGIWEPFGSFRDLLIFKMLGC